MKLKYADVQQITRSRSGLQPVGLQDELERISLELLRPCFPPSDPVRLLGVTLSNLAARSVGRQAQLGLGLEMQQDSL